LRYLHTHVYCTTIHNRCYEIIFVPISRWKDSEKLVYIYPMELFRQKKNKIVICLKIDGTANHHVRWNKPDSERKIQHVLSHMWNLQLTKKRNINLIFGFSVIPVKHEGEEKWEEKMFEVHRMHILKQCNETHQKIHEI
jgi:hypothetical protein